MADKVYYDSIEALGEKVLQENPSWAAKGLSARDAGDFYLDKYPHEVGIGSDPNTNQEWTAGRVVNEMVGPQSPLGSLAQGFTSGVSLGYSKDLYEAVGTERSEEGMMFGAGELLGETLAPYRAVSTLLKPVATKALSAASPFLKQLGYVGQAGIESAAVEVGKETRDENPDFLGTAALSLAIGAVPEGLVRGAVSGYKGAVEWALRPDAAQISKMSKLQNFLEERGITAYLPADVRQDYLTSLVSRRVTRTQLLEEQVQQARKDLMEQVQASNDRILSGVGPNAALESPYQAAQTVKTVVTDAQENLRKGAGKEYDDIAATEIGQTPINIDTPVTRTNPETGEAIESTLRESIRHFEGEVSDLALPGHGALRQVLAKTRRAHTVPESPAQIRSMAKERVEERLMMEPMSVVPEAEWDALRDQAITREANRLANDPGAMRLQSAIDEGPPGFFAPQKPVEPGPLPSGQQIGEGGFEESYAREAAVAGREALLRRDPALIREQAERNVDALLQSDPYQAIPEADLKPYIEASTEAEMANVNEWLTSKLEPPSYNWWWGRLKEIGNIISSTETGSSASRIAKQMYHTFQDAIDAQASAVAPEFNAAISHARTSWQTYRAYRENPLVREIVKNQDSEHLMPKVVFKNIESVKQAKRVLGADGFDAARQVWIRDLTDGMIKEEAETGISYISADKMRKFLRDKPAEYFDEIFSDAGFIGPDGAETVMPQLRGGEKRQLFDDLYKTADVLDESLDNLKIRLSNLAGANLDQVGLGSFVTDLVRQGARSKSILADLLLMQTAGDVYFKRGPANLLLGGRLPAMEGAQSVIPGLTRPSATSAALNRLGLGGGQQ